MGVHGKVAEKVRRQTGDAVGVAHAGNFAWLLSLSDEPMVVSGGGQHADLSASVRSCMRNPPTLLG